MNKQIKNKSFTIIELMAVIIIVGILSAFVFVQYNGAKNAGRDTKRKMDITLLSDAVVSYSNDNYYTKPITDADGCTINGDCPSSVSEALSPYLSSLPSDPDGASKYVYQSDGSDCTISATLSNGTVYQYACESNANTEGTPTPGVCGSAAIAYNPGTTDFTGTYCDSGRLSSTPAFPAADGTYVTWNCLGEYLGPSTVCTAYRGRDGICGTANNQNYTTAPSGTVLCADGLASLVSENTSNYTNYWTWTCPYLYAGSNTSCHSTNCPNCSENQSGSCVTKAAGEYGLPTCQRCNGTSLVSVNITDNTQDTEGSNLCSSTCKKCSAGSCVNQTSSEDLFSQCSSGYTSCSGNSKIGPDGYCSGSGSCKTSGLSYVCPTASTCQSGGGCSSGNCVAVSYTTSGTQGTNCTAAHYVCNGSGTCSAPTSGTCMGTAWDSYWNTAGTGDLTRVCTVYSGGYNQCSGAYSNHNCSGTPDILCTATWAYSVYCYNYLY